MNALLAFATPSLQRMNLRLYVTVQILLLLAIMLLLFGGSAQAQEASAASTVFDFGPIVAELLTFLAPTIATVLGLVGLWVLQRLAGFLKLRIDAGHRAAIEQGFDRAVAFAIEKLGDQARGGIPIDLKHDAVVVAAEYARRSVPDALRHFGVTDARLDQMVESRLHGWVFDPKADEVSEPALDGLVRDTSRSTRPELQASSAS